ncbi:MAG: PRC-barrel domain containing protein [Rhodoferax sp.]|nr:PRC-barrel domain containing protein [Rhodoferax sp.]
MLTSLTHITDSTVTASDGPIGKVTAAFFDDQSWAVRYLVVDTGTWLDGREVLISPYAVRQPMDDSKEIHVTLTCEQVRNSPDVDTQRPVSRQHERETMRYYGYPYYWDGGGMWGVGNFPVLVPDPGTSTDAKVENALRAEENRHDDIHLRSSVKVAGYDIQATDESIGHVEDFIVDDLSWAIRYLVVDTRNWWPGGSKVLIATHWIDRIDWDTSTVSVKLTREQVRNSKPYDETVHVDRDYEALLHDSYGRPGYWD